ncbi:hypothetical protein BKH46_01935 [Helicobacter sp. 12S02634-8]|uniref:CvfB family protein n=1 Tax=Helicobacter sp. 12S02634-8 TaxID=1476199 RepID=UPI000BD694CB|nr:S1-like domain-containing RNA-binding protein [Helicobacter sp. 12S02634-8]PAF48095.1 hypothetical protein BKH46_01935 [Helicobacter sp. 12S02634-8]
MQIGTIQTLKISRFSPFGAYLQSEGEEILLPNKFVLESFKVGDSIEVFVYTDSLDRPVATTQKPLGTKGEILALQVVSIQDNGCFMDLGIDKDIFMPSKNPKRFKIGQSVAIYLTTDKQNRLIAKLGIKEHLLPFKKTLKHKAVTIFPFENTPLGIGCVVEKKYYGLLYQNQIFSPPPLNVPTTAYIQKVRSDGKLDLSLKSWENQVQEKDRLYQLITEHSPLELDFSSAPQEIYTICQMSKKSFKTLINALLKEGKIKILPHHQDPQKKSIHPNLKTHTL